MSGFSEGVLVRFSYRRICGRARWMIHIFSLVCLLLATTSCGRWHNLKPDVYADSETQFRDAERAHFKHPSAHPEYCLALSGGGVRAAAYSIGVLKGLHEKGELSKIDIISAVSGGSYAATWLYAEKARLKASGLDTNFLSPESIRTIADKARLFGLEQGVVVAAILAQSTDINVPTTWWESIFALVRYTGGQIWAQIPPWRERHETLTGSEYEAILGKAFHSSPDSGNKLTIQTPSQNLPYLIVNATIQGVQDPDRSRLANRIFEFTSHGLGSPSVGYSSWAKLTPGDRANTYSLSRIVSISGAAVDKSTTNIKGFKYLNVLGRDLGLGYDMLAPTYAEDKTKEYFVLTDGGHSENLGVYGLIQRKCKNIVVVDAEYDGKVDGVVQEAFYGKPPKGYEDGYQFSSYRCLKDKLRKEGMQLRINELDQATNGWDCEGKKQEAIPETKSSSTDWNCWNKTGNGKRTLFNCSKPISAGYVHHCKDQDCTQDSPEDMRVAYIKLSADRELLDASSSDGKHKAQAEERYGPGITKFYQGLFENKKGKSEYTDFPHYSTFTLNLDKEAFLAIAELGCRAVMRDYDQNNTAKASRQSEDACTLIEKSPEGTGDKK